MNRRFLKGFCVASGLLCFAAGAAAQDNAIFSADRMARAEGDIAKMDETELRSLAAVVVDCSFFRVTKGPEALEACQRTREKYEIEYVRGRAIDDVLRLLQIVTTVQSGQANNFSFVIESDRAGQMTLEEASRLAVEALKGGSQPNVRAKLPGPGQITLEDIKNVLAQTKSPVNAPTTQIWEAERALRVKISETFKSRKAQ